MICTQKQMKDIRGMSVDNKDKADIFNDLNLN